MIDVKNTLSVTVSNDLSRANQIDMTGPNSMVLFAQTLVCALCYSCLYETKHRNKHM